MKTSICKVCVFISRVTMLQFAFGEMDQNTNNYQNKFHGLCCWSNDNIDSTKPTKYIYYAHQLVYNLLPNLIEPFKMKISSYIIWLDKSTYKDLGQNALIQNASKILTVQLFESFSIVDISSNHEKNKVIFSSIPDINMFISLFAKYNVKA